MPSQFRTQRRVEFGETDMAGIVHFANFYRYMEQAEQEFLRSQGLSVMQKQPDGTTVGWPRVSASCSFKSPAFYEDVLDIVVSVARKGVKSLTFRFEFRRGETLIAVGQLKTVCCLFAPNEHMRSLEMPPAFNERLQEHPDLPKRIDDVE